MPHYLCVHNEPSVPRETVEARWVSLAQEKRAIWVKTWYNWAIGKRYCWWEAAGPEVLERIFQEHEVTWEDITQVQLTTPRDWFGRED
jgi:Nickel responsive protein SCO4226-like